MLLSKKENKVLSPKNTESAFSFLKQSSFQY